MWRKQVVFGGVVVLSLAALLLGQLKLLSTGPQPKAGGGEIHGFIFASVRDAKTEAFQRIFLPDVEVFAKDLKTGVESPRVKTDVSGRYAIPKQAPGVYGLHWQAPGYVGGSIAKLVIADLTVYPQPGQIQPIGGVIFGRVKMKNGGSARFVDPYFEIKSEPHVRLVDAANREVTSVVRSNIRGEYLLTKVPKGAFRLIAEIKGASVTDKVIAAGVPQLHDLTFYNAPPTVKMIFASAGGKGIRSAKPGQTVQVTVNALDPNKDGLDYTWRPSAAKGAFVNQNKSTVDWTLPATKGIHTMYVLIQDKRGGYTTAKVDISTSGEGVLFTGQVSEVGGNAVVGATVSVNGQAAKTNKTGYFSVRLKDEESRYLLNIEKTGYQLLSRVLRESVVGGQYRLVKADVVAIDPKKPIKIAERRTKDRPGATVELDGNALVDAKGNGPSGMLSAAISTIDLRDPEGRLPGDFGALDAKGTDVTLVSYGALQVDIADAAGKPFNLAAGKTATLRLPVDPKLMAHPGGPPVMIPLWHYETKTGMWRETGKAKLVGNFYEATVKHFSVANVDVTKTDAACMRVHVDTAVLTLPFQLRITVPTGTGVDQVFTRTIADPLSVIVRLPPNTPIKLEVLDSAGNPIPPATKTVNSGPFIPGQADPNPPYPYEHCNSDVTLTFGVPSDNGFLTILDGSDPDNATSAQAYYKAIDPTNAKTTLSAWKTLNGFDAGDDADAVYLNAGDLGLGRWMHVKKKAANEIAYYVSNYGVPPNNGSADLAAFAKLQNDPNIGLIATVAMEFSALGAGTPYTKFYVFNAAGDRQLSADLDGRGQKFVPTLCAVCHGGNPPRPAEIAANPNNGVYPNNGDVGSKFIPFDPESFGYSGLDPTKFTRSAQESNFKALNKLILETSPTPAVKELVEGWYGGPTLPAATHNSAFVPGGWISPIDKSALYSQVIKTSCRSCHTTRDSPIDWARFSGIGLKEYGSTAKYLVCETRQMPQALRTFTNFWISTSPHRPGALANGGLDGWGPNDLCPVP